MKNLQLSMAVIAPFWPTPVCTHEGRGCLAAVAEALGGDGCQPTEATWRGRLSSGRPGEVRLFVSHFLGSLHMQVDVIDLSGAVPRGYVSFRFRPDDERYVLTAFEKDENLTRLQVKSSDPSPIKTSACVEVLIERSAGGKILVTVSEVGRFGLRKGLRCQLSEGLN